MNFNDVAIASIKGSIFFMNQYGEINVMNSSDF